MLEMFMGIFKLIFIILFPFIILFLLFWLQFFYRLYWFTHKKGIKIKRSQYKRKKQPSVFKRLFYIFPLQLALDVVKKDPDEFREWGIHLICGEQGSGKTITTVWLLNKWQNEYPKAKVYTNMGYKKQDGKITHWKDFFTYKNGTYGTIKVLDEIQTWFSSNQSKDFPIEMLAELSQQRKQRSAIIGTAQVFSRVAKPLREQTHYIYLPKTFLGVLTIVRRTKAEYWNDEKQQFTKYSGTFFLVQNPKIRKMFDTLEKIEKYKEDGFYINPSLTSNGNSSR